MDIRERALAALDDEALVQLTRALVRMRSINPPGDEAAVATYVAEHCERAGMFADTVRVVGDLPGDLAAGCQLGIDAAPRGGCRDRDSGCRRERRDIAVVLPQVPVGAQELHRRLPQA